MTRTLILPSNWEFVADTVMGGVSTGSVSDAVIDGEAAHRLTGQVSLENDGGFVQMAVDLTEDGTAIDASDWAGIELDCIGNDEVYDVRLRTSRLTKPWHSFRADFVANARRTTVRLPFSAFSAHRHDLPFDPTELRRIGVLAVGREFQADVTVFALRLYR